MDGSVVQQLLGAAQRLVDEGRDEEALAPATAAVEFVSLTSEDDRATVAAAYNTLAEIHRRMGNYAEAEPLYEQAMDITAEVLGADSEAHAVVTTNLALLRYERGDAAGAAPLAERAVELLVAVHGRTGPAVENGLRLLAAIRSDLGDTGGALAARVSELQSAKARLGATDASVLRTTNELAMLAEHSGDLEVAEQLSEALVEGARTAQPGSLDLAVALENLAYVYAERRRFADAAELHGEVLELRRELQGDAHEDVTTALERRAEALRAAGDVAAAVPLLEQLVERRRTATDEPELARSLNNLGAAQFSLGRLSEARERFEEALAIARRTRGEQHPDTARAMQSLATVHQMLGEYGRAEALLADAIAVLRAGGEPYRADLATVLVNLAELYTTTDRPSAGEAAFREALELRRTTLGEQHPSTLDTSARLAHALERAGRGADALSLLEQVVADAEAAFGVDHSTAFGYRRDLARLLRSTGQPERARTLLETDLGRLEEDPRAAFVLDELARLEEEVGDVAAARRRAAERVDVLRRVEASTGAHADALDRLADLDDSLGDVETATAGREEVVALRRSTEEPTSRLLASALAALADVYASTGRVDDALPLYREAIDLHRREGRSADAVPAAERLVELTRGTPDVDPLVAALALNDLAELHRGAGAPEAGVPLLLEALDLIRAVPDDPSVGVLDNNLGLAYAALGDHRRARAAFDDALAVFRARDEPSDGLAFALNNLSQTLDALGEHDAADDTLAESLDVRRELYGADSVEYATALLNRGIRLLRRGDLDAARPALEEALATLRRKRGDHHPDVAVALNALGHLHRRLGHYADAEALLRFALSLQQAEMRPDDPRLAYTLDNLAGVLHVRGDVTGADRMFRRAVEVLTRQLGPDHPEVATVLNNYGQLLVEVGRDAEADRLLTHALAISEAAADDLGTATVANNLGILRSKAGQDDAVPLLERGLELRRRVLGGDNLDVAQSLNNVAAAIGVVDPARARALLEQALEIRKRLLGPDHPDVAETSNNLSFVCGDRNRAAALLEDAVRIRRATNDGPVLADTLNNLAVAYVLLDQPDRALDLYRETADVRDRLIPRVAGLASERERLGYLAPVRAELALFLTVVRARMADRPEAVRLACDLVLRRKAVVTEGIADQRAAVLGGRYPSLREELRELDGLREQIAQRTLGAALPGPEADAELTELERRRQQLEVALAGQIPELDATRRLRAADTSAVAAALAPHSALVELVRVTTHDPFARVSASDAGAWYAAFIIPAGEPDGVQFVDLGVADALDELVVDFRAAITGRREAGADRDVGLGAPAPEAAKDEASGQALAQRLFEPLAVHLDDRRRLFVAADGELTRLPLEVLPLGDGRRVIDEYTVSYLGAGRDVLRVAQPRGVPRGAPVVVADPDYDLQAPASTAAPPGRGGTMRFTRLAGTRQEGRSVATMLGVQPLLGADAVEATIKACAGPSVLHIATHGFFQPDPADPSDSAGDTFVRAGLALAGANTASAGREPPPEAEDGILTAEDLAGLDLLGTWLVVLSACETGLGRVSVGEGVFGLRRSVTLAGAETLVMSLWKVPDLESCELMEHFYRRVIAGEERAAALRAAQLAIKERRPNPFYWGAFICEGNPGPVPLSPPA